jgi:subtilisin family serine protease
MELAMKSYLYKITIFSLLFLLIIPSLTAQNKRDQTYESNKLSEKQLLSRFNNIDLNDDVTVIVKFSHLPLATAYEGWKKWTGDNYMKALTAIERQHNTFMSDVAAIDENTLLGNNGLLPAETIILHDYKIVLNGMALKTKLWMVLEIADLDYIVSINPDGRKYKNDDESNEIIGADDIWSTYSVTGDGIVIAIVDTGIDNTHEAFSGNTFVQGYDFVNNDSNPFDDEGHGTHCAGIAAANGGSTIRGVAYGADLMAVKVLDSEGSGWDSDIIAGIEYAVDPDENPGTDDGANVINLSLGGSGNPDDDLAGAVDNASDAGVFCAVAAGNEGPDQNTIGSPGCARKCMSVANTNKSDILNSSSSRGPTDEPRILKPDIAAPGTSILSSVPGDDYESWTGTSMAAPHIAGAAALMMQQFPDMTVGEIKAALCQSSDDLGYDPFEQGHGRANVPDAFNLDHILTPPSKTLTPDVSLSAWEGSATFQVKNLTDASIDYDFSFTDIDFPGTFSTTVSPQSATVGAGSTQDVTIYFDFDDDASGYYFGKATAESSSQTVHSLILLNTGGGGGGGDDGDPCLSEYEFTDGSGTYNEITSGGTVLYNGGSNNDDGYWEDTGIGFDFSLCGIDYSYMTVYMNGYITLGDGVYVTYSGPIYNEVDKCISPLGQDLYGVAATSSIRVSTTGSSPNRICTIQFKNLKQFGSLMSTNYNFQIKLYETSNIIEFVYGSFTYTDTGYEIYDVGFTGDVSGASSDFYNRYVDSWENTWATSWDGESIEDYCEISEDFLPSSGQYYRWTPDSDGTLDPPVLVYPEDNSTDIPIDVTIDWEDVDGATSYNLQVALSDSFSDPIKDETTTQSQYSMTDLDFSTVYYYKVSASNDDYTSDFSTIWDFETEPLSAPTLVSPANNATGQSTSLTLDWTNVPGATGYVVQVSLNGDFSSFVVNQSTASSEYAVSGLNTNTQYYWRVKATNDDDISPWSSVRNFTTLIPTLSAPTLVSPANNATGQNTSLTLDWNNVTGATGYVVQVSLSSSFSTYVLNQSTASSQYSVTGLNTNTPYYWRVQATNDDTESAWSSVRNFTTLVPTLSAPTLVSPANNATDQNTSLTLDWDNVTGASGYVVQVSQSASFTSFVVNESTTSSQYAVSGLSTSTQYFWRVKATNDDTESSWSSVWNFTTGDSEIQDCPWTFTDETGNNATIAIPSTINPTIGNRDIAEGDAIGAFFTDGDEEICAGFAVYNGSSMGITVWGDDTYTTEKDGFANSEAYALKAWDAQNGVTLDGIFTVNSGPSSYSNDAITILASFSTEITPPTPTSPEDNSTDVSTSPTLQWTQISAATSYHLQVSTSSNFTSTLVDDNTLTAESYDLTDLGYLTEYFWRLRSLTDDDESDWSNVFSFTTEAAQVPWEVTTETGRNAQVICQTSIDPQIAGRDFANGDAIGAFYTNDDSQLACAGYSVWNGSNMAITVWGDDSYTDEKDGYATSETYKFKAWDGQTGEEYNVQFTISSGPTAFVDDGLTYLGSFEGVNEITQSFDFSSGWQMISAYVEPTDTDIEVVMESVDDNMLIMKNGTGDIYMPSLGINNINDWDILDGYKIYFTSAEALDITGLHLDPTLTTYLLGAGWHLISYIRSSPYDIEDALSDITDNLLICKNGSGDIYMPSLAINNIDQMNPGEGYQMYLTSYDELTYPANGSPRKANTGDRILTPKADRLSPHFSNTGNDMTLIIETDDIPERSEIAILTVDREVVGTGIVNNGNAAITIWGDNDMTKEKDGAILFENLSAELWNSKTKELSEMPLNSFVDVITNKVTNTLQYHPNTVVLARNRVEVSRISNDLELTIIPNPVNSSSIVEYYLPENTNAKIELYLRKKKQDISIFYSHDF